MSNVIPNEIVENRIYLIRGQKVMLDFDLAILYEIETKHLKRQVNRNIKRFPKDFMFELTRKEYLRCQNVTSKQGGRRYLPYAFTEQGIAMLSSVLSSEKAILVNIAIMRAFVRFRRVLITHKKIAAKLKELENKYEKHDEAIHAVFEAIRQLMEPPKVLPKRKIGFLADRD